jgi:hypothetical protein
VDRLARGIDVLDVGCGREQSTGPHGRGVASLTIHRRRYHGETIAGALKTRYRGLTNVTLCRRVRMRSRATASTIGLQLRLNSRMVQPVATLKTIDVALKHNDVDIWRSPTPRISHTKTAIRYGVRSTLSARCTA